MVHARLRIRERGRCARAHPRSSRGDGEARRKALYELYGNIWHQGTVYEASAYAVPFLVRIASSSEAFDRSRVVELLQALSVGHGYVEIHRSFLGRHNAAAEGLDEEEADERRWVASARRAVLDAVPTLRTLLNDADVKVRRSAPYLLGHLHEQAAGLAADLSNAYWKEADAAAKASIVLGLATLAMRSGDPTLGVDVWSAPADSDVVGLVQAVATASLASTDAEMEAAVEQFIRIAPGGFADFGSLAWSTEHDGPRRMMAEAVRSHRAAHMRLLSMLAHSDDSDVANAAIYELGEALRRSRSVTTQVVAVWTEFASSGHRSVRQAAVSELAQSYPACREAADILAANLGWDGLVDERVVVALAKLGDARARHPVEEAIVAPAVPRWIGTALKALGESASDLLGPVVELVDRLDARRASTVIGADNRLVGCLGWFGGLGADARPAVPVLGRHLASERAALAAAHALARLGPIPFS